MQLEAVGVRVAFFAEVAGKGLDAGVGVHVSLQVLVLLEPEDHSAVRILFVDFTDFITHRICM